MPVTRKRGRYYYGYAGREGSSSERSTECETRPAAERIVASWDIDAADPDGAAKRRATVDDALNLMLDSKRAEVKAGKLKEPTVGHYEGKARVVKTVLSLMGVTHLIQIDRAGVVRQYIGARRLTGVCDHTISKELTVLKMTLDGARGRKEYAQHWDDLLPEGFSPAYEPDLIYFRPAALNLVLSELLPDHAARMAWAVATGGEWSASTRARREDLELAPTPVRGSKRETRDRRVPVFLPWQAELLAYAKKHAQGKGPALFGDTGPTTFNHALYRACSAAGARAGIGAFLLWGAGLPADQVHIPMASGKMGRTTFGMWMRAHGVPVAEIALMLGHKNSRMAEEVYARIPADELQGLLKSLVCQPAAGANPVLVAHMAHMAPADPSNPAGLAPRPGFEPGTHGLTGLGRKWLPPRYDRLCRQTSRVRASPLPEVKAWTR